MDNKEYTYTLYERVKDNPCHKLDYDICIPTCRNRKPSILDHLDQFLDSRINVFLYENEIDLYDWLKNVNIVVVPMEYLSVQKMRKFIQQYMGDKRYYVIDDDIDGIQFQNEKINLSLAQGLKILEYFIHDKNIDFSYIGYSASNTRLYFNSNEKLIVDGFPGMCNLYDGKILREYDICFTGDEKVNEDNELCINSFLKGFPSKIINFGAIRFFIQPNSNKSIASSKDKFLNYVCNNYLKFGSYIGIKPYKLYGIRSYIKWNNVKKRKTQEWDPVLVDLCKKKDVDGIIEYIKK